MKLSLPLVAVILLAGFLCGIAAGRLGAGGDAPRGSPPPGKDGGTGVEAGALAALQGEVAALKTRLPDQSHAMADVAYHFSNLYFAAGKGNWLLARFYLDETISHLQWAVAQKPVRKTSAGLDLNLGGILEALVGSSFADIRRAIEGKDGEKFAAAYRQTIEGCYSCHKASEKPSLRLRIPEQPESRMVNPDPGAEWPK